MTMERVPRALSDMGNDIDEQMSALRAELLRRLGSQEAVARWFEAPNVDLQESKRPIELLRDFPDQVAIAAFKAHLG